MKKLFVCALSAMVSLGLLAQSVTASWDVGLHGGVGTGKLDTSTLTTGDPIGIDIFLNDIDFVFAGAEFEIQFEVFLNQASEVDADWDGQTGRVFVWDTGDLAAGSVQFLPADALGDLIANVDVSLFNNRGRLRVGFIYTDVGSRPDGTGTPISGRLGTLFLTYNNNGCDTAESAIVVRMGDGSSTRDAIFADDTATAVSFGTADVVLLYGNSNITYIRGDGNQDDSRNFGDLVINGRAAIGGTKSNPAINGVGVDWASASDADFIACFDFNCDGAVNFGDVVLAMRAAIDGFGRATFKNLDYHYAQTSGVFHVNSEGTRGVASKVTFQVENMKLGEASIDQSAIDAGWYLIQEVDSNSLSYVLANLGNTDAVIPTVRFSYESNGQGRIALAEALHQDVNLQPFVYQPLLEAFRAPLNQK